MMKAVVCTKYGPPEVLQVKEVEKPTIKGNEVLIRIYATTVTSADVRLRSSTFGRLFWLPARIAVGITGPRRTIPGGEFAGEIEAVGQDVKLFKEGDHVFGSSGFGRGANAEYIRLTEEGALTIKPTNVTYEEAAVVPFGGFSALFFLRDKGKIQSGQKVLIVGASGSVGTASIQVAKYFGAEVTGVCSTTNLELVKSLGADKLIDYTQEDFAKSGDIYDIIFDTVGKSSFSHCKDSLKQEGVYLSTLPTLPLLLQMLWTSKLGSKKAIYGIAPEGTEDLILLKELIEAGKIKPAIDRRYSLEQIAEAHSFVEKGHKKGTVILTIGNNNKT
jgi:NADPH:quinone reductase-like Zn-dependent oxidoreductase